MSKEYYKPGDHWLICDQCGRKMRYSASTKRWDNLIVHKDPSEGCFETRHPQEFVRPVRDNFPLPVVRPDNDGLEPTTAFNCDTATFRYYDRQDLTTALTIYKARVQGPVEVPDTVTIICELEVY